MVQVRARIEGAQVITQRDIDADFHSAFIANTTAGLSSFTDHEGFSRAVRSRSFRAPRRGMTCLARHRRESLQQRSDP